MDESKLKALIDKCLAGKASKEEQLMLEEWYASQDLRKGLTDQLNEEEKAAVSKRMLSSIQDSIEAEQPRTTRKKPVVRRYAPLLAAASVILIFLYWNFNAGSRNTSVQTAESIQWVEIKGVEGQVTVDTLTDGSVIWLNGISSIRYRKNSLQEKREVWLEGEGYFDVTHNPQLPFEVHAGELVTKVLGTEFNIRIDQVDKQVAVTVTEGHVAVSNDVTTLGTLQVNDQLVYNTNTGKYKQLKTDVSAVIAWKVSDLVYKEVRFKEIAAALEERFGSKIIFSNAQIGNCILTGTFDRKMNVKEILTLLCRINGNHLAENKNGFTISGEGCID